MSHIQWNHWILNHICLSHIHHTVLCLCVNESRPKLSCAKVRDGYRDIAQMVNTSECLAKCAELIVMSVHD